MYVVNYLVNNGFQIHPDAFAFLNSIDCDIKKVIRIILNKKKKKKNSLILIDDIKNALSENSNNNMIKNNVHKEISSNLTTLEEKNYEILFDPTSRINSTEGDIGYISLFRSRYEKMLKIFSLRSNFKKIKKIDQIKQEYKNNRNNKLNKQNIEESLFVSGLVLSRIIRKNNIELIIDDTTGIMSTYAKSDEEKKEVLTIVLDQMIMIEGNFNKNNSHDFIIKNIICPDIPDHVANKSNSECYLILISDLHIGSKYFMEMEFNKFLNWLWSGDDIINKIKFICIAGDIIDGIGIFPNQDKELLEMSIDKQIFHAENLLRKIPKHIQVFIIPGNHDPGRRSLPQGSFNFLHLDQANNFTLLGNPSLIKLNGVKILMFHGQSLDDIIASVPKLSYSKPAEAMKFMLKTRHLAPIYGNRTPLAPEQEDMLVISEVPDIFHSGHVHIIDVDRYKNTLIVNSGAWQSQTKYQQTMGIIPTPGIAIIINLATLQPFQKNFN